MAYHFKAAAPSPEFLALQRIHPSSPHCFNIDVCFLRFFSELEHVLVFEVGEIGCVHRPDQPHEAIELIAVDAVARGVAVD
jgi:hypothetical protein